MDKGRFAGFLCQPHPIFPSGFTPACQQMKMRVAEFQTGGNSDAKPAGTRKIKDAFKSTGNRMQQSCGYLSTTEMAKWAVAYDPGPGFEPKIVVKAQNVWSKQRSDLEDKVNLSIARVKRLLF